VPVKRCQYLPFPSSSGDQSQDRHPQILPIARRCRRSSGTTPLFRLLAKMHLSRTCTSLRRPSTLPRARQWSARGVRHRYVCAIANIQIWTDFSCMDGGSGLYCNDRQYTVRMAAGSLAVHQFAWISDATRHRPDSGGNRRTWIWVRMDRPPDRDLWIGDFLVPCDDHIDGGLVCHSPPLGLTST
jgi:hypothetical protein